MKNIITDLSPKKAARVAGVLYLLLIIFGVFAHLVARAKLIVWDDAAMTASNIMGSESLFRISFVADIIASVFWLLLPIPLYSFLKRINKSLALTMVLLVVAGVAMQCVNLLFQFAAVLLLDGSDYLNVFSTEQLQALALFFLNMHNWGYISAGIFHGLWLLPLGILVKKSGYFPKALGVLLIIAVVGFLMSFFGNLLMPNFADSEVLMGISSLTTVLGEFSFCGWLLFKGAKVSEMNSES